MPANCWTNQLNVYHNICTTMHSHMSSILMVSCEMGTWYGSSLSVGLSLLLSVMTPAFATLAVSLATRLRLRLAAETIFAQLLKCPYICLYSSFCLLPVRGGAGVVGFGVLGAAVVRLKGGSDEAWMRLSLNDVPRTSSKQLTSKFLKLMLSIDLSRLQSSSMLGWSSSGNFSLIIYLSGVKALVLICCKKIKKNKTASI